MATESRTYALHDLGGLVGSELGKSRPHTITQQQVDSFADATGDHQWIHVDPERAARGPFGTTIAHGYLTLSLLPAMLAECMTVTGTRMGINYGLNRLRFPSPVPVSSTVRGRMKLNGLQDFEGGVQALIGFEIGEEGAAKPAAVGEAVLRFYAE
jgi:acyl dehydratase